MIHQLRNSKKYGNKHLRKFVLCSFSERLMRRRKSEPIKNSEESDEEPSLIQNEHDFELVQRMRQLEIEIEKGRKIIEEREVKRSAFFKKQNKYYCQLVWKKLADENKDEA